jgi:hypothetical protein
MGGCNEHIIQEVTSPDGAYVATFFRLGCGPTMPNMHHINLRRSSETYAKKDNGTIDEGTILNLGAVKNLRLYWENEKTLKIQCLNCGTRFVSLKEEKWGEVNIKCEITWNQETSPSPTQTTH